MKKLGDSYSANGNTYKLVLRDGNVCVFFNGSHYEVFIVSLKPAESVFGVPYPEREAVPSNEEWGQKGWTFRSKDRAMNKFNYLTIKN